MEQLGPPVCYLCVAQGAALDRTGDGARFSRNLTNLNMRMDHCKRRAERKNSVVFYWTPSLRNKVRVWADVRVTVKVRVRLCFQLIVLLVYSVVSL